MKRSYVGIALLTLLIFASALSAQEKPSESKLDFTRRYVVLSTNRWSTLNNELKQALDAGYGVIMGNTAHKILILEKQPAGAPHREFKVVENLYRELKGPAEEGFRLIPATVGMNKYSTAGVAEKAPNSPTRFEYKDLSPVRTSSLQKDILEAAAQGYRPIALVAEEGRAVFVERPAGVQAQSQPESAMGEAAYLLLATSRSSTLQNELNGAVAKGYRVLLGAGGNENLLLLEKRPANIPAPEYLLVATSKSGTLEKEINQAASQGYRVLPETLAAVKKKASFLGTFGYEVTVVMEKVSGATLPPTYLVIGTRSVDTFRKELADAEQNNFELIRMILSYEEQIAILTKTLAK